MVADTHQYLQHTPSSSIYNHHWQIESSVPCSIIFDSDCWSACIVTSGAHNRHLHIPSSKFTITVDEDHQFPLLISSFNYTEQHYEHISSLRYKLLSSADIQIVDIYIIIVDTRHCRRHTLSSSTYVIAIDTHRHWSYTPSPSKLTIIVHTHHYCRYIPDHHHCHYTQPSLTLHYIYWSEHTPSSSTINDAHIIIIIISYWHTPSSSTISDSYIVIYWISSSSKKCFRRSTPHRRQAHSPSSWAIADIHYGCQ